MKQILFAIFVFALAGCAPKPVNRAAPAPAETATMTEVLASCQCGGGELRGTGIGKSEGEAFVEAGKDISSQIKSSITATSERITTALIAEGKEDLVKRIDIQVKQETELLNAQDVKRHCYKIHREQVGVVACMSLTDAAKPYKQSQIQLQDSIEFAALIGLKATYPKQKNNARELVNSLWARMLVNQGLLKGWDMEGDISKAEGFRGAVEDDYKDYCRTAKLHWNQEEENLYSDIAFSRLSREMKIEKSPCEGRGISLIYKNAEPKCDFAGVYNCKFQPTLSIASCDGTEYMLVGSADVVSFHSKEEVALEKLQNKLREESFWNNWENEISKWRPLCE